MDLSAVVVVDAGKLQADVAPSNDRQLLGQAGQVQDLVRDDGMLSAIDGQLHSSPSGRYQNGFGLQVVQSHLLLPEFTLSKRGSNIDATARLI